MSPKQRRHDLMARMEALEAQGTSCRGCPGTCCTSEANSMMVTPLETRDLLDYLRASSHLTEELRTRCKETISTYRLDQNLGTGKRSLIRRTYTCPFFNHQELGCPLPREVKPYGCLAFNSHHPELKTPEHCFSDKDVLEKVEVASHQEWWDKLPLPMALLELWDR